MALAASFVSSMSLVSWQMRIFKINQKPWKTLEILDVFCFGSLILSSVGRFLLIISANLFISYWQLTVSPVKPGISVSLQCNSQMSDTVTAGLEPNWTGMLESFWCKSLWLQALCQ